VIQYLQENSNVSDNNTYVCFERSVFSSDVCKRMPLYKTYEVIYAINLPDNIMLGSAYDRCSRSTRSHDLLQSVIGLQQQQRHRLFVLKVEVVA